MPITKSAKKSFRQSERRHYQNVALKQDLKDSSKKLLKLIAQKNIKQAEEFVSTAYKKIDKAAKKGVLRKNNASRKKSRLAKKVAAFNKESSK